MSKLAEDILHAFEKHLLFMDAEDTEWVLYCLDELFAMKQTKADTPGYCEKIKRAMKRQQFLSGDSRYIV